MIGLFLKIASDRPKQNPNSLKPFTWRTFFCILILSDLKRQKPRRNAQNLQVVLVKRHFCEHCCVHSVSWQVLQQSLSPRKAGINWIFTLVFPKLSGYRIVILHLTDLKLCREWTFCLNRPDSVSSADSSSTVTNSRCHIERPDMHHTIWWVVWNNSIWGYYWCCCFSSDKNCPHVLELVRYEFSCALLARFMLQNQRDWTGIVSYIASTIYSVVSRLFLTWQMFPALGFRSRVVLPFDLHGQRPKLSFGLIHRQRPPSPRTVELTLLGGDLRWPTDGHLRGGGRGPWARRETTSPSYCQQNNLPTCRLARREAPFLDIISTAHA